jgi:hypothetical protein
MDFTISPYSIAVTITSQKMCNRDIALGKHARSIGFNLKLNLQMYHQAQRQVPLDDTSSKIV